MPFPGVSDAISHTTAFASGNVFQNLSKSLNEYQNLTASQNPIIHNSAIETTLQQLAYINSSSLSLASAALNHNIQSAVQNLIESEAYRSAIASASDIGSILNIVSAQAINVEQEKQAI